MMDKGQHACNKPDPMATTTPVSAASVFITRPAMTFLPVNESGMVAIRELNCWWVSAAILSNKVISDSGTFAFIDIILDYILVMVNLMP